MVGKEYKKLTESYLKENSILKSLLDGKPKKQPSPISKALTDSEIGYYYKHSTQRLIYKPMYDAYKKEFIEPLVDKTKMVAQFGVFKNTGIYERYMLNSAQFAAAKANAEGKLLQAAVFDEKGVVKSYSKFYNDAHQITDIQNNVWLRVERDTAVKGAVSLDQFSDMTANADIFPYWIYKGVMDDREREEHVELEDKIFMIGDPEGDDCFPPNGFNCRCSGDPLDDSDIKGQTVSKGADNLQHVDKQFQYNPANQGILPKDHSYFDVMPSANSGNSKLFDMDSETESAKPKTTFRATGMHYLINQVNEWKQDYHVDKLDNIIFQNKQLYSNIVFTNNSLHAIQNHAQDVEKLPDTIENPDMVWSKWADAKDQKEVLRTYIKDNYVVMTKDGKIIDARRVYDAHLNRYRKGVPLL